MSDQPMTRAQMREMRERRKPQESERRKPQEPERRWTVGRVIKWLVIVLAAFGVLGVAGVVVAYAMTDVPKPNEAAVAQASTIYYSDGKTVMDRIATVNRESVPLDKVPDHVQKAFLAAEDRTFYQNDGISPKGIARAVWVAARGGEQQGGSTITQQYVKNYFLTQNRTISRKIREILISIKIEREESKDQILESYLNTIYFGRGADGIQTASKAYFGKDVSKLTVSQGALLASVIRAPSLYDPRMGKEQKQLAQGRWQYVIDGMLSEGWITQKQHDNAKFPKTRKETVHRGPTGPTGFVVEAVRNELHNKLKLTDSDIDRGGFKIVTTIDKKQQDAAKAAVEQDLAVTGKDAKKLHAGLVSIKPGDGAVQAMYGGKSYGKGKLGYFNTAMDAKMQGGSTFKIFALIAALEQGVPLWTRFDGHSPITLDKLNQIAAEGGHPLTSADGNSGNTFSNYGNEQEGNIDLVTATKKSVNTVYLQLNAQIGASNTAKVAKRAGVTSKDVGTNLANVLGTGTVTVMDMADAYATIAAEGKHATPYFIKSIKGSSAFKLDYTAKPQVKQVFSKDVMRDTMKAMSAVIGPGGTGAHALQLGRPAAGKTGTTSSNYAAWFDGYTPGQLATAVGIYMGDGSQKQENQMNDISGVGEVTGSTLPLSIWTDFMAAALQGRSITEMPPPGGVGGSYTSTATSTTPPSSTSSSTSSSSTSTSTSTTTTTHGTGKPTKTTSTTSTTTTSSSSTSTSSTSSSSTKTNGTGSPTSSSTTTASP